MWVFHIYCLSPSCGQISSFPALQQCDSSCTGRLTLLLFCYRVTQLRSLPPPRHLVFIPVCPLFINKISQNRFLMKFSGNQATSQRTGGQFFVWVQIKHQSFKGLTFSLFLCVFLEWEKYWHMYPVVVCHSLQFVIDVYAEQDQVFYGFRSRKSYDIQFVTAAKEASNFQISA